MATLAAQAVSRDGLNPTLSAAQGGGDKFLNTGSEFVYVRNQDAAGKTVTFDIQVAVDGQAVTDRSVTVPAGEIRLIGPFQTNIYNDGQNMVNMTYSAVTSLTVGVVSLAPAT